MKQKTYSEKLRDPRWQKKRLEVMSAARFECENCGSKDSTLNVHHKVYRRGKQPWEYPVEDLSCLCEECHSATEELRGELSELVKDSGALLERVIGYTDALRFLFDDASGVVSASYERCEGIADALRLPFKTVLKAAMESSIENGKIDLHNLQTNK